MSQQTFKKEEQILWKHLRDNPLSGYKFNRQHRIEEHVFAFYSPRANVAIEIDRTSRRDYKLDAYLAAQGIAVLHLSENEIRRELDDVLARILDACRARTSSSFARAVSLSPHANELPVRIAPTRSMRVALLASVAIVTIVLLFFVLLESDVSRSIQGNAIAQRPLATLTRAPTRSSPMPSPTLGDIAFPTLTYERDRTRVPNLIFVQAEKYLESQPQSVADLLLPQLSQFTSKSDLEDAYSYLGRAEFKLGHYRAAAGYLKQLYSLEPSVEYLNALAVAYDLDGDWQNALTSYRALEEWNGNDAAVYRASAERRIKEIEQKLGTPTP